MKDIMSGVRDLGDIERRGFERLSSAVSHVSEELSNLASVMEWGFEEIKWELQQQTHVLESIDHTLKNPSQTQAHEWRRMAEQLRQRGCLNEAAEWFSKALKANPLDYRIYVGLAMTCLQGNNFDKARELLEKSLPHAPKGRRGVEPATQIGRPSPSYERRNRAAYPEKGESERQSPGSLFDYRSNSYRLIGRIFACKEDWANAASSLRSAIELSPGYEEGNYEYAQYSIQVGDRQQWTAPLREAILARPNYWYMAWAERNFAPVRKDLAGLLKAISSEARKSAVGAIGEAERTLQAADQAISQLPASARLSGTSHNTYTNATQKLAGARGDAASVGYPMLLKAAATATESMRLAQQAREQAVSEGNQLTAQVAQKREQAWAVVQDLIGPTLGWVVLGWFVFGTGGCLHRASSHPDNPFSVFGAYTSEGLFGALLALAGGALFLAWEFKRTLDGK